MLKQSDVSTLYVAKLRAKVKIWILGILEENLEGLIFSHVLVLHKVDYDLIEKNSWTL